MGHTNSTANLSLPQFIGTDKPTWLGDINGAFSAIDSYAGTNDAAVAAAVSDASSAISQASAAVNTANTANTTAGNASTAANNAVGVANTANAIAGTVDAKVGLLADLNTTDRTSIVNAINEVHGDIFKGSVTITADGIKSASQLLDELHAAADTSKIDHNSVIKINNDLCFRLVSHSGSTFNFGMAICYSNKFSTFGIVLASSGSVIANSDTTTGSTTISDSSATPSAVGTTFELIY